MVKHLFILLCILLLVGASPTNQDTTISDGLIYGLENTQENYLSNNGKYEQVKLRVHNNVMYYMDEYISECGPGYVITTERILNKKRWIRQKHVGCETDRSVNTNWKKLK